MLDASDLLLPMNLMEVNDGFLKSDLLPRRVYLLNTQKLSKSSRLVQSGTNQRQVSFWEVLANTINGRKSNLYFDLGRGAPRNEAGRGPNDDRPSAIAHVLGEHEPIVFGSRTIGWVYPESIGQAQRVGTGCYRDGNRPPFICSVVQK